MIGLLTPYSYAFAPLCVLFERPAPMPEPPRTSEDEKEKVYFPPAPFVRVFDSPTPPDSLKSSELEAPKHDPALDTALLIPCYKSAKLLPATLTAALKIFPATSIFVLANGNSPTPLDDTEDVCIEYGVNHVWCPVGSKIVAQYVGAYVARSFPYALLIDDDCLLPPNFPIVTDRLRGNIKCLGYTITSIGEGRSRGTYCQQAQDLEYKLSGLQRLFAGKVGSSTFPHGAIVLWDTEFLIKTFKHHPGFSVSEDWFFGHVARELGSRIVMCSSVFVETETPSSVFYAGGGAARGGFGEMTVFKQRFKRWNFFFVNGCYYNLSYILFSWRLKGWELGAKLFVFQEVYETFLYLITPFVLPIMFVVQPPDTAYVLLGTFALYLLNSVIFNEVHLRLASWEERDEHGVKKERKWYQETNMMVSRKMLFLYYMPFKAALTFVNVASTWWSLWQYAKYFAKRHPKIIEDERAVGVVLKIEEGQEEKDELHLNAVEETDEHVSGAVEDGDGILRRDFTHTSGGTHPGEAVEDQDGIMRRDFTHTEPETHGGLRKADATNTAPSGFRGSIWGTNTGPFQMTSQGTDGTGRMARRLTVTAIKVDVMDGAATAERLQRQHTSDSAVAPDEILIGPVDEAERAHRVVSRTRTRSVAGQLHHWTPGWLERVGTWQSQRRGTVVEAPIPSSSASIAEQGHAGVDEDERRGVLGSDGGYSR